MGPEGKDAPEFLNGAGPVNAFTGPASFRRPRRCRRVPPQLAIFFFAWLIFSMYFLKNCFCISFMSISRPWMYD